MDTKILEEIGLTKSEISVYLALLELGSSATGKIVDKSKVASSKIYEILDKLMQKGLVSFIIKSGVKYFEAAPPERIMDYMKEKEEQFNKQKNALKDVLPELELKQKLSKYKSEATIYKGLKGAETAMNDVLKTMKKGEEYYLIGGVTDTWGPYARFIKQYHEKRSKLGIKVKILYSEAGREWAEEIKHIPHTEIKFAPSQLLTSSFILMYKDKTLMAVPTKNDVTYFKIDNKEVTDSFKSQFDLLWNQNVKTYQGIDAIKNLFVETLDFGDYDVFAEGTKIMNLFGEDFFVWWQNEKKKRGIKSRGIMGAKYRLTTSVKNSISDFKFIPGYENPGITFVFKDKVLSMNFSKNPIAFLIENKEIADSNRAYFNLLWNQKVQSFQGQEAVQAAYDAILEDARPADEVVIFAAKPKTKEGAEYNFNWNKELRKKVKNVRLMYYGQTKENKERAKEFEKINCETKIIPTEQTLPISTVVAGDVTLNTVWGENPVSFKIENKIVAESLKGNFELLWGQEAFVVKGIDALNNVLDEFLDGLEPGESYDVLGVTFGVKEFSFYDKGYSDAFKRMHKKRVEKGVKARLLFQQIGQESIKKYCDEIYKENYETKTLPYKTNFPVAIIPSNNQTFIIVHKKEPSIIIIKNKEVSQAFKKYFESLWNQDAKIVRGLDAIQEIFEDMLKYEGVDFIGARGYFIDARPEYMDGWEKRAKKSGFKIRNLVDPEVKGHRITKFSFAQTKYTLSKEFASLSAFWIYGNKVVITNWVEKEPIVLVIENKNLHDMYKNQFEVLWNKK